MVDAALEAPAIAKAAVPRSALRKAMQRKSTIAFLMTLPLLLLVTLLVLYPALYSVHLATLNKSMERFVGFDNFLFLFKRETFWMVVRFKQGEPMEKTLAWAESEIEGFMRT